MGVSLLLFMPLLLFLVVEVEVEVEVEAERFDERDEIKVEENDEMKRRDDVIPNRDKSAQQNQSHKKYKYRNTAKRQ